MLYIDNDMIIIYRESSDYYIYRESYDQNYVYTYI